MNSDPPRPDRTDMLEARIGALEEENQRLRRSNGVTRLALVLLVTVPIAAAFTVHPDFSGEVLNVQGLNIVDGNGVHRITLGISGDTATQSATFYGRTFIRRAPPGAYVLFFDDEGTEQGGIGIPDDGGIFYGLDSRTGQNISLGTSADGRNASIRFWTVADGERDAASIGIFGGEPRIKLVRDGEVVFQRPGAESGKSATESGRNDG